MLQANLSKLNSLQLSSPKLSPSKLKLTILAILSSSTLVLTACQSVPSSDMQVTHKVAQSSSLQSQLQLLNKQDNPSVSAIAKTNLLVALDKHLATEHMSVLHAQYKVRPFIAGDSVDQGSRSLLQTVLATASYQKQKEEEEDEELLAQYMEDVEQEIADGELEEMSDDEIVEEAESRFDDYKDYYDKDKKLSNKVKKGLSSYMQMKAEQAKNQESTNQKENTDLARVDSLKDLMRAGDITRVLKTLYRTPEQVDAIQYYQMQHLQLNAIGHHNPTARQYQTVYSVDANTPTQQLSIQIPVAIDFDDGVLTLDPSAVMPIVALLDKDSAPLPKEMKTHTIAFSLPDKILAQVPADVIYDAILNSVNVGFKEMDSEDFTAVDIKQDSFAKQVGAKTAVKVHWGAKQMGEFLGRAIKSIGQDIQAHIDSHPEQYKDRKVLVEAMEKWQLVSQDFQSKDVGGLIQIFEAIAPINFNKTVYYYLNGDNHLTAYQAKVSMGSELYGWTMDSVVQTKYANSSDDKRIRQSALYPLFNEDFGVNAPVSIDGNKWLADKKKLKSYKSKARYARYDYDYEEASEEGTDQAMVEDDVSAEVLYAIKSVEATVDAMDVSEADKSFTDSNEQVEESEEYRKTKEAFLKFQH